MASSTYRKSASSSGSVSRGYERGIPRSCKCGEGLVMRTSRTVQNPGRIFHCCPLRKDGDNYHLFKWSDESMLEDMEDLKEVVIDLKECIANHDNEIKKIKDIVVGYEKEMVMLERVVSEVENDLKNCIGELKSMKNIIVGVGVIVIIGLYYLVV